MKGLPQNGWQCAGCGGNDYIVTKKFRGANLLIAVAGLLITFFVVATIEQQGGKLIVMILGLFLSGGIALQALRGSDAYKCKSCGRQEFAHSVRDEL
ncbi:hypothetical protein ED21_25597 [Erythrobacter sp. SD-21]|nr:hypothetical protein ED21_25597 [Erythrobacter sp. SD-21]